MTKRPLLRAATYLTALVVLTGCARIDSPGTAPVTQVMPVAAARAATPASSAADSGSAATGRTPLSAPLPSLAPAEVALQSAMPGLFGASELHPEVTGDVISVWSQQNCPYLLEVLRAGQWTIALIHRPTRKGQRTWAGTMRKRDARALLVLNGGTVGCSGRIVHDENVSITASGAAKAHGDGRFLSFLCMAQWDDTDSGTTKKGDPIPSQEFLVGLYTIGGRGYLIEGELPTKPGTFHVTAADIAAAQSGDDDSESPGLGVLLLPKHSDPLPVLISSFGIMLYPLDMTKEQANQADIGSVFRSYPAYAGGPTTDETITITSNSPLSGTVTATGLVNQQHPSKPTLDFSAPFSCDR